MRPTTLKELVAALKPSVPQDDVITFSGIGTDTRRDLKGQLFWALRGEDFDAHNFLPQAVEKGATGLVVQTLPPNWQMWARGVTVIQVPDTLKALQDYARFIRRKTKTKVIGITGSNGKTSTKEFAASLLKNHFRIHWNKGSFNNHFGLPFNLLSTPDNTEIVIAELGMNHAGELKTLCEVAEPDVVVCTMVGSAHIEHFGSSEKIAEAKEEIYQYSPEAAIRIYNRDNPLTAKMLAKARAQFPAAEKILTFSQVDAGADVFLKLLAMTSEGIEISGRIGAAEGSAKVAVYGQHQVTNLSAAAALALAAGVDGEKIWQDLPGCKGAWGRMHFVKSKKDFSILFDGYNANPESMKALFETLNSIPSHGKRYAVLAEMKELGGEARKAHEDLGMLVGKLPLDAIWFYGPSRLAFEHGTKKSNFKKKLIISDSYEESLASEFVSMLHPKDLVVVKGSRGMKTERFVEACQPLDFSKKD